MALGLFFAVSVLVTTTSLVLVLPKLNEPGSNRKEQENKNGLTELTESERRRIRELFIRETNEKRSFDQLRASGLTIGYTHHYLWKKFSIANLTTTASLVIVLDLVKLDLAEGVKPEEIVFGCCWCWPKKDVISAVIGKTGAKIKDVLEYENKNGINCLMIMFHVLIVYINETGRDPAGTEMATQIEKSVHYVIELGEEQGLDMNEILEKATKSGETLFSVATRYTQNLALILLLRQINVKSINDVFVTPQFKFSSLHHPMIASGINPFALDFRSETQFDSYLVSGVLIYELNPDLTPDLFFSTISQPCNDQTCSATCEQGLPDPWYYKNGQIWKFKEQDRIGRGGGGVVFSGLFHGQPAAFKLVEIKNLKFIKGADDATDDLNKRLSEMKRLSETKGQNILHFCAHIRQQLSAEKVKELGLGETVTRYEVYITKKCEFNLADLKKDGIDIDEAKEIIDQLIAAQEQLQAAGVCHNDIKPGNILVDYGNQNMYDIYVGDFGQADQLGGTPGWTPPEFINPRVPGESDMYSFGLLFLYVLCEDDEVFYSIRDNFIKDNDANRKWFLDLMNLPVIQLVQHMTEPDHNDRISLRELKSEWKKIRNSVEIITPRQLGSQKQNVHLKKSTFLTGLDSVTKLQNIQSRNMTWTETKTTFSRTHLQGDTTLCWLYSFTSSLHQSMKLKSGTIF